MKRFLRVGSVLAVLTVAVPVVVSPGQAFAQAAAEKTAMVHGKVTQADGRPFEMGQIKFTQDRATPEKDRKYPFTFPVGAGGVFKGEGIPAGAWLAVVYADGKTVDYLEVTLKAGEDHSLDFDMTREEYLKALSPEVRAQIEETKKKNAGANAYNAKIADINKTLLQARADAKAGDTAKAVAEMQGLTQAKPDEGLLWVTLGEMQLADANAAAKAARAAHTSPMDAAIVQKYTDAGVSYQKGIDLAQAATKKQPEVVGLAYLNLGEADAKSGKFKEATDAYDNAVKANPTLASQAYYNEAAILFNAQKMDEAGAAADKAIAADPKRAEAYYIKAQTLIPKATMDEKTKKFVLPPGCLEAYQQYLDLAPDGAHAAEVKDLLTNLGQPVKNSYKAGKK
ncbi:tetratricopeptide repeat protein [Granulicella tundricola]|uniref:Tetratricopeptide TPR_1 repeat-containing protein n=1 Tax=Granulicella tundricola (strain ATCC BAA-1859 / DSM 23138 / MP5ACTX9) TaxID=1198114 RepID=E8X136_GRATM|nr:tetratricopeptide repeat protein [Granulicella tundricola]ADW67902.1 Tetratricopeptide TPR_1 repeat-containing protein [Granulicella tundricola MP5ACTX9]